MRGYRAILEKELVELWRSYRLVITCALFTALGVGLPILVRYLRGITRLFGCAPREYLDNPHLWRDRVHPDDVPRIAAWVDKMFESDKRALEYRIRNTDGTTCKMLTRCCCITSIRY